MLRQDSNKLQNLIMKVSFLQTSRNKHKIVKFTEDSINWQGRDKIDLKKIKDFDQKPSI